MKYLQCGRCAVVHIIAEGQWGGLEYVHRWNLYCGKGVWNNRAGRESATLLEEAEPTCISCIVNGGSIVAAST